MRQAVAGYVADVELTATRVQLEELKRRQDLTAKANRHLQTEIQKASAEAAAIEEELKLYVSTVEENCTVGPDLIERLRNR